MLLAFSLLTHTSVYWVFFVDGVFLLFFSCFLREVGWFVYWGVFGGVYVWFWLGLGFFVCLFVFS